MLSIFDAEGKPTCSLTHLLQKSKIDCWGFWIFQKIPRKTVPAFFLETLCSPSSIYGINVQTLYWSFLIFTSADFYLWDAVVRYHFEHYFMIENINRQVAMAFKTTSSHLKIFRLLVPSESITFCQVYVGSSYSGEINN